ncbi:hypothetical protein [Flavobacterium aestivum]|uniref:hypothetical protein n=1 Tax=Flavobacterium aestivum TaxID=3003257 RepID=UPI0022858DE5|nr:hypothetical protein [Flavobacterium aestivum]
MKTNKDKKTIKKFDLKKFEVVKFKKMNLINGGGSPGTEDPGTITNTSSNCERDSNQF